KGQIPNGRTTYDEYFDYYRKRHAHWKMYGLSLPDSVLRKIYY
ncbi:MAG: amidohydrolase, partial [Cyclobacteriaceae bacterium]|nr:amidohydrolase [Cyclobacteriaceae bacterium]